MVHTAVVLPAAMLERLKGDAKAAGWGLSSEIRRRLLLTYEEKPSHDRETRRLAEDTQVLADYVSADVGRRWHEHSYAKKMFAGGLATFVARHPTEGDENIRPEPDVRPQRDDPDQLAKSIEANDAPETIGRTYARLIMRRRSEDDFEGEELERLHRHSEKND